jgi:hypothetical protein
MTYELIHNEESNTLTIPEWMTEEMSMRSYLPNLNGELEGNWSETLFKHGNSFLIKFDDKKIPEVLITKISVENRWVKKFADIFGSASMFALGKDVGRDTSTKEPIDTTELVRMNFLVNKSLLKKHDYLVESNIELYLEPTTLKFATNCCAYHTLKDSGVSRKLSWKLVSSLASISFHVLRILELVSEGRVETREASNEPRNFTGNTPSEKPKQDFTVKTKVLPSIEVVWTGRKRNPYKGGTHSSPIGYVKTYRHECYERSGLRGKKAYINAEDQSDVDKQLAERNFRAHTNIIIDETAEAVNDYRKELKEKKRKAEPVSVLKKVKQMASILKSKALNLFTKKKIDSKD